MDSINPNNQPPQQGGQPLAPIPTQPSSTPKLPPSKTKLILAGCALLLILIPVIVAINAQKKSSVGPNPSSSLTQKASPIPSKHDEVKLGPATLVFGVRDGKNAILKTYDLATETTADLTYLASGIKRVNIISPQELVYIDQIDTNRLGKQIVFFDRTTKDFTQSLHADDGYGINEYILSPNKQYITTWELSYPNGKPTLQGGHSRIYAINLSRPHIKNLLYDEPMGPERMLHYPVAMLNDGKVLTDKLLPHTQLQDADLAYGLSMVEFDGANKQDLDQVQNGSYGSKPMFSPDGKYLLFIGYDGLPGDGATLKDGVRQVLFNLNTIETLDLNTFKRSQISITGNNLYDAAYWDQVTGRMIIHIKSSSEKDQTGFFSYDLKSKSLKKIDIPQVDEKTPEFISLIPNTNKIIIAMKNDSEVVQGTLGNNDSPLLTEISIIDPQKPDEAVLAVKEPILHYITTLPLNYFK